MPPRTLVVGDIQGCCDELEDLLAAVGFVSGTDQLVSVGDLVNKGPRSLDVLRLFRQLGGETVLGNHEIHLLEIAAGGPRYDDTMDDVLAAEEDNIVPVSGDGRQEAACPRIRSGGEDEKDRRGPPRALQDGGVGALSHRRTPAPAVA